MAVLIGDCLEVLPSLPALHFSVAIADPPYIIGGTSVGDPASKSGTWADMVNAATWYREWFDLVATRLRPTGYLLVFGNWRSLPTYLCAAARCEGLRAVSCMVWDKLLLGTAPPAALRSRWELILWLARPDATVSDRSAPDVISEKWHGNMATSGHPAEKPVSLLRRLVELAAPDGGPLLDPFAGRGSSGLAALDLGRDFTLIEVDPEHCRRASLVLSNHRPQLGMRFSPAGE